MLALRVVLECANYASSVGFEKPSLSTFVPRHKVAERPLSLCDHLPLLLAICKKSRR